MRIRAAAVLLATVAPVSTASSPAAQAAAAPAAPRNRGDDPLEPPIRDPNERPFMPPRHGGARPDGARVFDPDFAEGPNSRRRVQLTLMPLFASFPLAFLGRRAQLTDPTRGGGAGLDLDIQISRPFWLRFLGTYSGHPVPDVYARDTNEVPVRTAHRGTFHAGYAGASVVYAMDYGRLLPLLELGPGVMFLRSPEAVQPGQMGGECREGLCDVGLRCVAEQNICQPWPVLTIHFGLAVDVLLKARWTVGLGLRYFAFLTAPASFPIYLQAAARFGVRF
jgi:hypothetical protein